MSIATEISRLQNAKSDLKTSINAKLGSELIDDETIDEYADFVDNIQTGASDGYVRVAGVPDGENIIANAEIIESGGINYYPIAYIALYDINQTINFTKTGSGISTGADAYIFSDEPNTLYIGDTTHTF